MQIFNQQLVFTGSVQQLPTDLAGNNFKCTRILVEIGGSNSSVCYVGGPGLTGSAGAPTNGAIVHRLQVPDTNKVVQLDSFNLSTHTAQNDIQYSEFSFIGTANDLVNVTVFVA